MEKINEWAFDWFGDALLEGEGAVAVNASMLSSRQGLNLVQKWLGHAQLTTTAIYANAIGAEEKTIAQRMWT